MADVGTAYVQIIPSAKGFSGKLKSAFNGGAQSAGESAGSSIAGAIKSAIVAAGIGKVISASIMEGGKLQQSLGGVETLFKGSASTVKKNADAAFKTAGLSANDYMENVTSFSASLISSLGGDTKKAASMADMAMRDMSDNSNKMGLFVY